ncbi:helix-turn-helix domain-containing protein [Vibrio breoganii]|uniref:helix-turn-helix domain-containing protein n=1 Tax=Vibrio breoganii TaxID=553239 RepID=UPI000C84905B|nr:helix-turn-helix domain-containing protein [Vibrio breoganii]PMJ48016.1 hypothetical protein BCU21_04885 [Vibrio breoganii]PMK57710.1 hypothetical protein BCT97_09980 [Vibrio breoganii]PMM79566.1 hypothetical protein BCT44_14990 [Vibrio breoganii]PMO27174.1 hypothetical protein BCT14_13490 [Vibrio breoganii]PMO31027.1 hypothetical protein BCT13_12940 [Vibrio breoganii]
MSLNRVSSVAGADQLVAYLIDSDFNTVPKIVEATGMPRRTAQDTIKALHEIEVKIEQFSKGKYRVIDWGAVNKSWVRNNFTHVCTVLSYPCVQINVDG